METDIGRVSAACTVIKALGFYGKERDLVLSALHALERAVKDAQSERDKAWRSDSAGKTEPPDFLRRLADYQDAPLGTVVAKRYGPGWWLKHVLGWVDENGTLVHGPRLDVAQRWVVRWGDD